MEDQQIKTPYLVRIINMYIFEMQQHIELKIYWYDLDVHVQPSLLLIHQLMLMMQSVVWYSVAVLGESA